ncbi:MAG: type IV pilin protein [Pseudomonadota bacterium]
MTVRNRITSQRGFTLVELMTVVAIIGVLATVGVPQYRKIQRKAKRAEATLGLGVIASGEAGFFAEYNGYGDNLGGLGVELQTAPLSYNIGFLNNTSCEGSSSNFKFCETGQGACTGSSSAAPNAFPGYQSAQIMMASSSSTLEMTKSASSFFRAFVRSGNTASGFPLKCNTNAASYTFSPELTVSGSTSTPSYVAGAAGNLYNQASTNITVDAITINEQRVIQIVQDGT